MKTETPQEIGWSLLELTAIYTVALYTSALAVGVMYSMKVSTETIVCVAYLWLTLSPFAFMKNFKLSCQLII